MSPIHTHTNKTFSPRSYLDEYYSHIGAENEALIHFFADSFRQSYPGAKLLDFGGGPTIYPLISAAPRVSEIYFSDYLLSNLQEVQSWHKALPQAFPWSPFVARALEVEGKAHDDISIQSREKVIRERIKYFFEGDIHLSDPLKDRRYRGYFDIIISNFVAESITSDRGEWQCGMTNLIGMLKPKGMFLMSVITNASFYRIGANRLPCVSVTESDVIELLCSLGFAKSDIVVQSIQAETQPADGERYQGYRGMSFFRANKKR